VSETAAQRTSRLLALLPWLASQDEVGVDEAALEFGISRKQLLMDLATLTFTGPDQGGGGLVDIDYEDGTISVLNTQGIDRPLRLTTAEAAALVVGLQVLEQVPGTHDKEAITRAQTALKEAAGKAAEAVAVRVRSSGYPGVAAAVTEALAGGRALEIQYEGAARDVVSTRAVDPIRVLVAEGFTYLEAYCRRAKATRLFRLDRIVAATVLSEASQPHPAEDSSELFDHVTETLILDLAPQSRWVIERYPTTSVQERPDGSVVAQLPLADPEWAVRLGLSLAGRGAVLAPAEIVAEVARRAQAALDLYEDAGL
jgi:proteasome accessory factor C